MNDSANKSCPLGLGSELRDSNPELSAPAARQTCGGFVAGRENSEQPVARAGPSQLAITRLRFNALVAAQDGCVRDETGCPRRRSWPSVPSVPGTAYFVDGGRIRARRPWRARTAWDQRARAIRGRLCRRHWRHACPWRCSAAGAPRYEGANRTCRIAGAAALPLCARVRRKEGPNPGRQPLGYACRGFGRSPGTTARSPCR
jgi:hypothetical protein